MSKIKTRKKSDEGKFPSEKIIPRVIVLVLIILGTTLFFQNGVIPVTAAEVSDYYDSELRSFHKIGTAHSLSPGKGSATTIAIFDTGIVDASQLNNTEEEFLYGSVGNTQELTWFVDIAWGNNTPTSNPDEFIDLGGHGTMCVSAIRNVAPNSRVIVLRAPDS